MQEIPIDFSRIRLATYSTAENIVIFTAKSEYPRTKSARVGAEFLGEFMGARIY
jgi:hypothetical protein